MGEDDFKASPLDAKILQNVALDISAKTTEVLNALAGGEQS